MAEELTAFKMLVSSFTFYLFLTEFDRKPISKIICSLAYAFSGFAIFFSEQMVFLSFYSLVPLYLLGVERYLKHNKWQLFTIMCALLFATNFYLFYTLSALTPLYFIYRYFSLEKDSKDFFRSVIRIIGYYLLGSLISSFLWLPSVLYILSGNGRFLENIGLFHNMNVYINYIISFFVPNYLYLNRGNMFDTFVYYNREICCWASTILIVLVPQFIKLFNKNRKMLTLGMYGFFTLIALFPILCSILHGFSDPSFRWTFFVINFNLLIISEVLDNINLIDYKLLVKTVIIFTLIILFGYFYGVYTNGSIGNYINQLKTDNTARNQTLTNFKNLMAEDKTKENIRFKSDLESLIYSLNRVDLKNPDPSKYKCAIKFETALIDYERKNEVSAYVNLKKEKGDRGKIQLDSLYVTDDLNILFAGLIEILYQIRCLLIHGNLEPEEENHEVIKYCYFVLLALMQE